VSATGQAIAQGTLAATPFMHLLLYLYRKQSDGTLVVRADTETTIVFHKGRPTTARFSRKVDHILEGLAPLCGLTKGYYAFYEGNGIGDDPDALHAAVDPYALLTMALREHPRDDVVESVLAPYDDSTLRILPGREIGRLRLRPDEQVIIELLRASPSKPRTLVLDSPLSRRRTQRVLYALLVTKMVAPDDRDPGEIRSTAEVDAREIANGDSDYAVRHSSRPPVQASPRPPPKRAGAISFSNMNTVAIPPASQGEAKGGGGGLPAWQRLASLRPGAMPSMSPRATPASGVRPSLVPELPPDASVEERLGHAAKLIDRGKAAEARPIAEGVLAEDQHNADALAIKAHTMVALATDRRRGLPKEILTVVRTALRIDPDQARALLVKGLIYKYGGEPKKALNCFRRAVAEDPKNIEAQRELRLARMRQS
jgi:hypothetical protein